ncbi:hypothetical protein GCM10023187_47730 [Nibrella viscosa]|uniref:ScyD/ScyE family protein n=1 Tax=Nibrella viscosa TaxID=1084524 RepID=A0ABP8KU53_9BACT
MKSKITVSLAFFVCLLTFSCRDHSLPVNPAQIQVFDFAANLLSPMGMDTDPQGRVWLAEAGTGKDDGRISVILPNGSRFSVITGFPSFFVPTEPFPVGLNHLLYINGTLYILHANGLLYKADVSQFVPGTSAPVPASNLQTENIGQFVVNYDFGAEDTGESNPFNLTMGPNGELYIADAAANSIIRRATNGTLSVFATLPRFTNPTNPMIGPPKIDPVPTGIVYDGNGWFYVTTLTGFPFIPGQAAIYRLGLNGVFSVYQSGLTTLVDVELGSDNQPLAVHFADFALPAGFAPNTGSVVRSNGSSSANLLTGLNLPTDLEKAGPNTYYINSLVGGTIKKVTY